MKKKGSKKKKIAVGIGGSIGLLVVGLVIIFIIGEIRGWKILEWFASPQAFLVYAIVIAAAAFIGILIYRNHIMRK